MQKVGAFFCVLILLSGLVFSQEQYGNLRGIVVDTEGEPLPGVTLTLVSEEYGNRTIVTAEGGVFRFLNISPGVCMLQCDLPGFKTYMQQNLDIRIGTSYDLEIVMEPATLQEEVTIVAESPVVDTKKVGTSVNVTLTQLQEIPSARDPWVILQQAPGILVSQENVGGSHSGMQAGFRAKGVSWPSWNMDGIDITDSAARGSPTYYDFDQFEEMQIVTSGGDSSQRNPGVTINFVTRRGGNKFEVMGRFFYTDHALQGNNLTPELEDLAYVGNQIDQIMDYGLQIGGPIIQDKFWFWLGYGTQDITRITIDGYPDHTVIEGINAKFNFQLSRNNRGEFAVIYNDKKAYGRGAGPTRPPETTWDQTGFGPPFFKLEDQHTFNENLFLGIKLSYTGRGFSFDPKGGIDVQHGNDLATGIWSGSAYFYDTTRPSYNAVLDGNFFVEDLLGGDHEFKFGVEYRFAPVSSQTIYPGDARKYYWNGQPYLGRVYREGVWKYGANNLGLFINDAFSIGRLTLNFGFRLDRDESTNYAASVRASRVAPDLLPGIDMSDLDPDLAYWTFSPRLGFTFALTADRKTILKGNLARYSYVLWSWLGTQISPIQIAYATYYWKDLNGDDNVSTNELVGYPTDGVFGYYGFDPWNPTALESPNGLDRNFKAPLEDELIIGITREIITDFSLAFDLTLRRSHRVVWWPYYDQTTGSVVTNQDYVGPIQGTLTYDGKTYDYEYWTLSEPRPPGDYLQNRPDFHRDYIGFEIIAHKRLSNRWMLNASFTYQNQIRHFGEQGYDDPTNLDKIDGQRDPNFAANWMAKLGFLYQLPWDINFSLFGNARQGYLNWQRIRVNSPERAAVGLGATVDIYTETPGTTRYPDFYNLDISLGKDIRLGRYGLLTLQVDSFNVFNFNHVLNRYNIINSSRHDEPQQILNPRVVRFGVRYRF